jgi:hypothetical protein
LTPHVGREQVNPGWFGRQMMPQDDWAGCSRAAQGEGVTFYACASTLGRAAATSSMKTSSKCRRVLAALLLACCLHFLAQARGDEMRGIVPGKKTFDRWETVSAETKQSLRGYIGDVWVASEAPLAQADAHLLASVRGDVVVSVPSISPDVAKILCSTRGSRAIFGVSEVSEELAAILGDYAGPVSLLDCYDIPPDIVRALLRNNLYGLSVGSLRVTADNASVFAGFRGRLTFFSMSLTDGEATRALLQHRGRLWLWLVGLAESSAAVLADADEKIFIRLYDPVRLTERMAENLASHSGCLELRRGVAFAPSREAVLAKLAQHRGTLRISLDPAILSIGEARALGGQAQLPSATAPAAAPTGGMEGRDSFGDLEFLDPFKAEDQPAEVVGQLARRRGGKLSFLVVGRMSAEFARALATHVGPIRVETTKPQRDPPTAEAVAALCAHRGSLDMPGRWIRPDTIERVMAHEGGLTVQIPSSTPEWIPLVPESEDGEREIEEWQWIPNDLLKRLALYPGPLHIQGDPSTDEIVQILASHRGPLALDRLPRGEIGLRALLNRDDPLFITENCDVRSVAAAKVFASANNRTAICTSRYLLGTNAAEIASILVTRSGPISFPELKYINADALRILATKPDVQLPPLGRIFILSNHGFDVEARQAVSAEFLKANKESVPPPSMPEWHSWDRLLKTDADAEETGK